VAVTVAGPFCANAAIATASVPVVVSTTGDGAVAMIASSAADRRR
jgi:hypothetical protein